MDAKTKGLLVPFLNEIQRTIRIAHAEILQNHTNQVSRLSPEYYEPFEVAYWEVNRLLKQLEQDLEFLE